MPWPTNDKRQHKQRTTTQYPASAIIWLDLHPSAQRQAATRDTRGWLEKPNRAAQGFQVPQRCASANCLLIGNQ
jgi:hypothetical protein